MRDHRRCARAGRHARHEPVFPSRFEIVADHPSLAGDDHLFAGGRFPHGGRAIGDRRLPCPLPLERATGRIQRHDARSFELVTHQDDQAVGQDGRDAAAEIRPGGRRRQRERPQLFARHVITDQAAGAEIRHNSLTVRGRSRGRGTALVLEVLLDLFGRRRASPGFRAVAAAIRDRVQLPRVERGKDDVFAGDNRRRQAARHRHFPFHIRLGSQPHARRLIVGNARAVGSTKPGPRQLPVRGRRDAREPSQRNDRDQLLHV